MVTTAAQLHKNTFVTDGTKSVPLASLTADAWTPIDYDDDVSRPSERISPYTAYAGVPTLYRAVDLRAKALAGMPYALYRGGVDVSTEETLQPLRARLRTLLYLIEAAQCLYGAAYCELATNRAGKNLTAFWLQPQTVQPYIDPARGLTHFRRLGLVGAGDLQLNQVLYVWQPSVASEIGPGMAPARVVLSAAGLLRYLDMFATGFFARGAIKVTLLSVEGNPLEAEMRKLETWWKRMVTGVRQAFQSIAIKSSVKPVVIGSGLDETAAPELNQIKREDVAIGMGVPLSLILSNAANFATAQRDTANFYTLTMVPEARLIEEPLNAQYLSRLGLRLEFRPEQLEVFQTARLQMALSLRRLTSGPILTVDEARAHLGMGPMPQSDKPAPAPDPNADPDEQAAQAEAGDEAAADRGKPADATEKRLHDLVAWRRKALKRVRAGRTATSTFASAWISDADRAAIATALRTAQTVEAVRAVFAQYEDNDGRD